MKDFLLTPRYEKWYYGVENNHFYVDVKNGIFFYKNKRQFFK